MILVPIESALIVTLFLPCTVSEIRRLIGRKLRIFHALLLFGGSAPPLSMFPLEFRGEVKLRETIETWG